MIIKHRFLRLVKGPGVLSSPCVNLLKKYGVVSVSATFALLGMLFPSATGVSTKFINVSDTEVPLQRYR